MSSIERKRIHLPVFKEGEKYIDTCRGVVVLLFEGEEGARTTDLDSDVASHSLNVRHHEELVADWPGVHTVINRDGTLDFCPCRDSSTFLSGYATRQVDDNGRVLCGLAMDEQRLDKLFEVVTQLLVSSGRFYDEKLPRLKILPGPCIPHWGQKDAARILEMIEGIIDEERRTLYGPDFSDVFDESDEVGPND